MRHFACCILGALAVALASPASTSAAVYSIKFTQTNAGVATPVNLLLTTVNTLNSVGGYNITSISGTVGAEAVTSLVGNPSQPNVANNGRWMYNNVFFPASNPTFDVYGVVFTTPTAEYNLWGNSPGSYTLGKWSSGSYIYTSGQSFSQGVVLVNTLVGVPEPLTWMFMLSGLGAVGLVLRRRRRFRASLGLTGLSSNPAYSSVGR